jgi:hypothetical protein
MKLTIVKSTDRQRPVGCPWLIDIPTEDIAKKTKK